MIGGSVKSSSKRRGKENSDQNKITKIKHMCWKNLLR
jgi:hypothetical protein